jgi:hypothetical protein
VGQPGGSSPQGPPAKAANRAPVAQIKRIPRMLSVQKLKQFSGTATDPDGDVLRKVQIALVRKSPAKSTAQPKSTAEGSAAKKRPACLALKSAGGNFKTTRAAKGKPCPQVWLNATGTTKWSFPLKATLPPGRYVLFARAADSRGLAGTTFSRAAGNRLAFKLTAP